jgi:hypothetical protein
MSNTDDLEAKAMAIRFHETYERLAPSFGYETRKETRVFDPESPNGKLMIAVCGEVARSLAQPPSREVISAGNVLREVLEYARQTHNRNGEHGRADEAAQAMAILAAISEPDAHAKDPAPTAERVVEAIGLPIYNHICDARERQFMYTAQSDEFHIVIEDLRTRLKTLFP